jgi:hypothetical protein
MLPVAPDRFQHFIAKFGQFCILFFMSSPTLTGSEVSLQPTGSENIRAICGVDAHIIADPAITFTNLALAPQQRGKLIRVTAPNGKIKVDSNADTHLTTLTFTADAQSTVPEMLIRVPSGVRFFKVHTEPQTQSMFYAETAHGFNIVPMHLEMGKETNQAYEELLLLTTPEPPRQKSKAEIEAMKPKNFVILTVDQKNARVDQNKLHETT